MNCEIAECQQPFKYKCPICYVKYCGIPCYKIHKASPCTPPSKAEPEQKPYEIDEKYLLSKESLELMSKNPALVELFKDKSFQRACRDLKASPDKEKFIQHLLQSYPDFVKFADILMSMYE